jgi:hypothetical protein
MINIQGESRSKRRLTAYTVACLGDNGDSSIEAHARLALDVVAVGKTGVESAVWDDHAFCGEGVAIVFGCRVCRGEDVVADGVVFVEDCMAKPDLVAGPLGLGRKEGDGPGGFGQDVLATRVDEGYHGTADIEAERGQLGKSRQAAVLGALGAEAGVGEALCARAIGGIDEVLGIEPGTVVSEADRVSRGSRVGVLGRVAARGWQNTREWALEYQPKQITLSSSLGIREDGHGGRPATIKAACHGSRNRGRRKGINGGERGELAGYCIVQGQGWTGPNWTGWGFCRERVGCHGARTVRGTGARV